MSDLGIDLYCLDDLDEAGRTVSGVDAVRQAAYHRITTRALVDDDDYGIDVRELLGNGLTDAAIANLENSVRDAVSKDPRVTPDTLDVVVSSSGVGASGDTSITIEISAETEDGPFELVVSVNELTVDILSGRQP